MTFIDQRARSLGLRKVDARTPLEVEVIPEDITRGRTKTPGECALARACKRTYKVDGAYFFKTMAWLEHDGVLTRYTLPARLQREVFSFDRSRAMAPGVYHLTRPSKWETLETKVRLKPARPKPPEQSTAARVGGKSSRPAAAATVRIEPIRRQRPGAKPGRSVVPRGYPADLAPSPVVSELES